MRPEAKAIVKSLWDGGDVMVVTQTHECPPPEH